MSQKLLMRGCVITLILAIMCVAHQEATEMGPGRRLGSSRLRKIEPNGNSKISPDQNTAPRNEDVLEEVGVAIEAIWSKIGTIEQQMRTVLQGTPAVAVSADGAESYPPRKRRSTDSQDEEVDDTTQGTLGAMEIVDSGSFEALAKRLETLEGMMTKTTARSCDVLRKNGVKASGTYVIDPDGADFGEAPIEVHCEFLENGESETMLLHEHGNASIAVDNCGLPGCSGHRIKYKASLGQINALIEISQHCEQEITYNCLSAPLSLWGNLHYSWWIGSDGTSKKYYWSGGANSQHVCACGLAQNCTMAPELLKCNCDAGAPEWFADHGVLTDKDSLPIRSLHFGGLQYANQKASFILGPLKCSGANTAALTKFDSCRAMKVVGHRAPGYYVLDSTTDQNMPTARVARCNLDLHMQNPLFEETMLRLSSPVVFSAVLSEDLDAQNEDPCCTTLTGYGDVRINRGDGFDGVNGTFTSPVAGIYFFSFQANAISAQYLAVYPRSYQTAYFRARIHQNNIVQAETKEYPGGEAMTIALTTVLELNRGDVVHVSFRGRLEAGEDKKGIQFMGFLLHPL